MRKVEGIGGRPLDSYRVRDVDQLTESDWVADLQWFQKPDWRFGAGDDVAAASEPDSEETFGPAMAAGRIGVGEMSTALPRVDSYEVGINSADAIAQRTLEIDGPYSLPTGDYFL